MEQKPTYVGIDVAKAQVDVAVRPTGQRWVVSYDETGVGELVSQMKGLDPAHPSRFSISVRNGALTRSVHCLRPVAGRLPLCQVRNRAFRRFAAKLKLLYTPCTGRTTSISAGLARCIT